MTQRGVMEGSQPDSTGSRTQSEVGKPPGSAEKRRKEKKRKKEPNQTEAIRTCCRSSVEVTQVKYKPAFIGRPLSSSRKTEVFIFTLGEKMKETHQDVFNEAKVKKFLRGDVHHDSQPGCRRRTACWLLPR